jgi:cell division protein FtsB
MATRSQSVARGAEHVRSRTRIRVTGRAAGLLIVAMLLVVALVYPGRLYLEQRGRISDLEQQTKVLTDQNMELNTRVQKLNDPVFLERLARECLGMVRPGETAFVLVPRGGDPRPIAC